MIIRGPSGYYLPVLEVGGERVVVHCNLPPTHPNHIDRRCDRCRFEGQPVAVVLAAIREKEEFWKNWSARQAQKGLFRLVGPEEFRQGMRYHVIPEGIAVLVATAPRSADAPLPPGKGWVIRDIN